MIGLLELVGVAFGVAVVLFAVGLAAVGAFYHPHGRHHIR